MCHRGLGDEDGDEWNELGGDQDEGREEREEAGEERDGGGGSCGKAGHT